MDTTSAIPLHLEELHRRKLWHQLTSELLAFVQDPNNNHGDNFIQLYEQFVTTFEQRINQLDLIAIASQVATQFYPTRPFVAQELERALAFMTRLREKRARIGEDAFVVISAECISLQLKRAASLAAAAPPATAEAIGLLDDAKKQLEATKSLFDSLPEGTDASVAAAVHRAAAEYYKLRGPAHLFYESALLWLGSTSLDVLPAGVGKDLAVDVALAALVGEGVYNFGEINNHPLLKQLADTPHAWLSELLAAFQTGDIDRFNGIVGAHRAEFDAQPALVAASAAIKEKLTLLAVMELAATKPPSARTISFDELARETRLPLDQMEWVLMRALSLGLIAGKIDEVARCVHVSFLKPRVLDSKQINAVKEKAEAWRGRAKEMLRYLEDGTHELLLH